ncbi:MAG: hypothetical protein GY804_09740 [Alphaproteobacteria bacterium]|nr:hypothetical protein [Alphaproteobacteria bacterium]
MEAKKKDSLKMLAAFIAGGGLTQVGNVITSISDEAQEWLSAKPREQTTETRVSDFLEQQQAIDPDKPKREIKK